MDNAPIEVPSFKYLSCEVTFKNGRGVQENKTFRIFAGAAIHDIINRTRMDTQISGTGACWTLAGMLEDWNEALRVMIYTKDCLFLL